MKLLLYSMKKVYQIDEKNLVSVSGFHPYSDKVIHQVARPRVFLEQSFKKKF